MSCDFHSQRRFAYDLTDCMKLVEPLLVGLSECWEAADKTYREEYSDRARAEHTESVAAQCRRQHMWMEVVGRYDGVPGCNLLEVRGLKLLNWWDQAVIRFKKVDGAGRHQNFPTPQQNDFDDQLPLPNLPAEAVRLTSGYQLDASGEFMERKIVARVRKKSVLWAAQVDVEEQEASWIDISPRRFAGTGRFDFGKKYKES
jgi:hypothetical protein